MDIRKLANPGALKIKPYVPGRLIEEVKKEYGLTEVIKLASNESALGVPEKAIQALKDSAEGLYVYPDPVSAALCKKLGELHGIDSACITVANGADGVIYELAMAVVGPGDECIYPETTFPMYESSVKIMNGEPVISGMKGLRIDLDDILEKITARTKIIYLTNPNNPTGDAIPAYELTAFLKKVPPHILVVLDEAYIQFAEPGIDPDSVGLFKDGMENLIILRTFSKIYGLAGIRVGYGIAHPDLINLIHTVKPPFPLSVSAQAMAMAALECGDFYSAVIADVKKSRKLYYEKLDAMGLEYVKSHTNFVLLDTGRDAKEVCDALMARGIIVRPATGYGLPTSIRVTFGTPEQNLAFFAAFEEIMAESETDGGAR